MVTVQLSFDNIRRRQAYARLLVAPICYLLFTFLFTADYYDANREIKQFRSVTHFLVYGFSVPVVSSNPPTLRRYFGQNMNHLSQSSPIPIYQRQQQAMELPMCICINCARVLNCSAYYFVESKHEQPHISSEPTFTPRDGSPTIHVNVRTERLTNCDSTGIRIWSEQAKISQRADSTIHETTDESEVGDLPDEETSYKNIIPITTTYEYDVVACVDFVEDVDCWIRNMPDEIKRANPNFVPT